MVFGYAGVVKHGSDVLLTRIRGKNEWTIPVCFVESEDDGIPEFEKFLMEETGIQAVFVRKGAILMNKEGERHLTGFFASSGRGILKNERIEAEWFRTNHLPDDVSDFAISVLEAFHLC